MGRRSRRALTFACAMKSPRLPTSWQMGHPRDDGESTPILIQSPPPGAALGHALIQAGTLCSESLELSTEGASSSSPAVWATTRPALVCSVAILRGPTRKSPQPLDLGPSPAEDVGPYFPGMSSPDKPALDAKVKAMSNPTASPAFQSAQGSRRSKTDAALVLQVIKLCVVGVELAREDKPLEVGGIVLLRSGRGSGLEERSVESASSEEALTPRTEREDATEPASPSKIWEGIDAPRRKFLPQPARAAAQDIPNMKQQRRFPAFPLGWGVLMRVTLPSVFCGGRALSAMPAAYSWRGLDDPPAMLRVSLAAR